ncbi:MAG: Gfo/Idh/MocA family oxidoreductase [Candidatus Sungbacteria bacterium]|uniref:Gfo/Idh/MocA family oxidoreductase n=1 Tax=Candidatus Sungiibacteriota bacterium TaxID=2750080 RepID=A0A931WP93_9BACT|nr:Gfo/Idh/MocA family oxidoreductase [Candidatus Sungbacteria bacterium]
MHESVKRARELVAKNKLGKLTYIEMKWSIGTLGQTKLPPLPRHMQWREKVLQAGGGAIMARGVHLFDLLRFITGMEINEVRAYMDNTPSTVDRTTIGIVLTDKKTPVVIVTSKIIPEADNSIALHGTKGRLIIRDLFSSDSGTLYTKVFDEFARAQNGKKTVLATLEDGLAVIAITGAFISSSGKKRAVRVR